LAGVTGIDDPYEPPLRPELRLVPCLLGDAVDAVLGSLDAGL
jgi:hypothetical protein